MSVNLDKNPAFVEELHQITPNAATKAENRRSQIKPYLKTLSSSQAAWDDIVVEHNIDLAINAYETISPAHLVAIHYGQAATLKWTVEGCTKTALFTPGDINLNPFGNSAKPQWQQQAEFILLAIEPTFLTHIAQESGSGGRVEMVTHFKMRDPLIEQIAIALMNQVERGGLSDRLYAESLTNALAFHLLKNYSVFPSPKCIYSGGLSPRQLQNAIDYMNDNLDRSISLCDLADAVEVSSSHFARAFKRSTGTTPHKYLTQQRITRAKHLLSNTNLTMTEIAFELGFSSQGHFTTVFRQMTGVTPKSYKKAL